MAEHERARATNDNCGVGVVSGGGGAPTAAPSSPSRTPGEEDLWCSGPLLRAVQGLGLFEDSKHFVDMPLLTSREEVMREFEELLLASSSAGAKKKDGDNDEGGLSSQSSPLPPREALLSLVERHFAPPGTELEAFEPPDFEETPRDFLPMVRPSSTAKAADGGAGGGGDESQEGVREFALRVHRLWPHLCRRQRRQQGEEAPASSSSPSSSSSSLLATAGWSVVPGARFRESYYWDSYWTVRGCLASRMPRTAAAVVATLCELAGKSGRGGEKGAHLVPNGARTYYLGRSQPPLLADAAAALFLGCCRSDGEGDEEDAAAAAAARRLALEVALPAAKAEHAAWCRWPRTVRVELEEEGGGKKKMASFARYRPHSAPGPRPEAWREDIALAAEAGLSSSEEERRELWLALAAAAESGWDFSTRWLAGGVAGGGRDGKEEEKDGGSDDGSGGGTKKPAPPPPPPNPRLGLAHLVVPVDLNVFLARAEAALSTLCLAAGDEAEARRFADLAGERLKNIDALLWDAGAGSWADLRLFSDAAGEECGGESGPVFRAERRNAGRYASCWSPLWVRKRVAEAAAAAGMSSSLPSPFSELDLRAVSSLLSSGLVGPGGLVAASLDKESREQWDGENAWPPLQAILAEGLADAAAASAAAAAASASDSASASAAASELSERIVRALVLNVKAGLARDGCVREKYRSGDAECGGWPGGGGEYETQVGFGWSNGAALCLLRRFGWPPSARVAAEAGEVGD